MRYDDDVEDPPAGAIIGMAKSIAETEKAIRVVLEFDKTEHWVPKSQIHDDSEVFKNGQSGDLVVTEWYAEQKGWI